MELNQDQYIFDSYENLSNTRIEKRKCNNISNETICYSSSVFFTILMMQFFIIYIVFSIYSEDLNNLLKDGRSTMKDLSVLIPEVGNTLRIVQQICETPEYAPYCHTTN